MAKKVNNLSRNECYEYSNILIKQSYKRFIKGRKLAKEGEYGDAIEQEILAAEELMKAFILAIDSKGFNFRNVKSLNTIFNNHGLRYFQAFFLFAMGVIGEEFVSLIMKVKDNPKKISRFNEIIKSNEGKEEKFKKGLKNYGVRKLVYFRRNFLWFIRMNTLRQKSMYVDYNDGIVNPNDFTEFDYIEVRDKLKKVRAGTLGMIKALQDPLSREMILSYQKKAKEKDLYNKVENSIGYINKISWDKMSDREILKLDWAFDLVHPKQKGE